MGKRSLASAAIPQARLHEATAGCRVVAAATCCPIIGVTGATTHPYRTRLRFWVGARRDVARGRTQGVAIAARVGHAIVGCSQGG